MDTSIVKSCNLYENFSIYSNENKLVSIEGDGDGNFQCKIIGGKIVCDEKSNFSTSHFTFTFLPLINTIFLSQSVFPGVFGAWKDTNATPFSGLFVIVFLYKLINFI